MTDAAQVSAATVNPAKDDQAPAHVDEATQLRAEPPSQRPMHTTQGALAQETLTIVLGLHDDLQNYANGLKAYVRDNEETVKAMQDGFEAFAREIKARREFALSQIDSTVKVQEVAFQGLKTAALHEIQLAVDHAVKRCIEKSQSSLERCVLWCLSGFGLGLLPFLIAIFGGRH